MFVSVWQCLHNYTTAWQLDPTCVSRFGGHEIWLGVQHLGPEPRTPDVRTAIQDAFDAPSEVIGIIAVFIPESASDELHRVLTSPIGCEMIDERSFALRSTTQVATCYHVHTPQTGLFPNSCMLVPRRPRHRLRISSHYLTRRLA